MIYRQSRVRRTRKRRENWKAGRKKKPKPDPMDCTRCGTRMVERLIVRPTGNEWELACGQCGNSGGKVVVE